MSYYLYGEKEPIKKCPYCNTECIADWVDIGIAYQQCGPYYCERCGASEKGPYDSYRELSDIEKKTGWYAPGKPISDKANQINGKPIDHETALVLYKKGIKIKG